MATARTEIRRRQGSRHDKTGCLTCRHRRKKCTQNTFPICGTCARLNLECIREPPRNVVPESRTRAATSVSPLLPVLPLVPIEPYTTFSTTNAQRRHALKYYITVLTQHVSVSEQFNSFLSAFLPMALESKALADSIVSWASGHLATTDNTYALVALETHSSAVRNLSESITSPHYDLAVHETNAAACLVLLISEVCRGDREIWYSHLHGAKSIITSAQSGDHHGVDAFRLSDEGQWVLRNFAYHDVLASVTLGRPPLLDGAYLDGITDVVDSCVGVATSILKILADICALEHRLSTDDATGFDARPDFQALKSRLESWDCSPVADHDLAHVAYAYRSAAQIVLFRACRHASSSTYCPSMDSHQHQCHATIADALETLLDAVKNIPLRSLAESALVFPLFIAGGEANTADQQDQVRVRLQLTLEQRQFGNITRALSILEDLWRRKQNDHEVDWKSVLAEAGGGLILT